MLTTSNIYRFLLLAFTLLLTWTHAHQSMNNAPNTHGSKKGLTSNYNADSNLSHVIPYEEYWENAWLTYPTSGHQPIAEMQHNYRLYQYSEKCSLNAVSIDWHLIARDVSPFDQVNNAAYFCTAHWAISVLPRSSTPPVLSMDDQSFFVNNDGRVLKSGYNVFTHNDWIQHINFDMELENSMMLYERDSLMLSVLYYCYNNNQYPVAGWESELVLRQR